MIPLAAVAVWKFDSVQMLALGCLGVGVGMWLKKKLRFLERWCIPTSIVGGMVFALAFMLLRDRALNVETDNTLRDLLMIAFMTTIGLNARLELIRRGGIQVVKLLVVASLGAIAQNLLGIGLAKAMSLNPLIGIVSGSIALTGGPATAAAFGPTFEQLGVNGATEIGLAAATCGIAVAGLVGGYIGARLIRRHRLSPKAQPAATFSTDEKRASALSLLTVVLLIGVSMGLGNLISNGFTHLRILLPSYIGAMIAAATLRNLNDRFRWISIAQQHIDDCALISLYLFIVLAVLSLQLWKLANLALPLIVILAAQVALCWLMCVTALFWAMGRDYESAVMASGFCGFMLGITQNAMASMEELAEQFGPAPQSFLVIPLVGAFLVDFTNSLIITVMANLLR